jgi:type I restriction enzyme M protein
LHKTIWKIANDLRGSVDGWEFKAYVLGSIFYRFISENICDYIQHLMAEAGQPDFDYTAITDEMGERIRQKMVEEKGYFILPSQLFQNVVKQADKDENLNEKLTNIFRSIEASAQGTESEDDLRGLFSDFTVDSAALGSTVIKRNQLLAKVLQTVAQMDLGSKYNDTDNDTFGDTYEFLMQMYASEAGKSGASFLPLNRSVNFWHAWLLGIIPIFRKSMTLPVAQALYC